MGVFYKSFNKNLQGHNNFQFNVGEVYEINSDDDWMWFHYAKLISATLIYYCEDKSFRVCEVEPLGNVKFFKSKFPNECYYTTNKIKIGRELTKEEIFTIAVEERCKFSTILNVFNPSKEFLLLNKKKIRGELCRNIILRTDLSLEDKKKLLPKAQQRFLQYLE